MIKGPKKTISLELPQDCYDKLKGLANDTYRTVPGYIRMIIYNYLRRLDSTKQTDDWWVVK